MVRTVARRWCAAAGVALLTSVAPIAHEQLLAQSQQRLVGTDPAELPASADNGRRAGGTPGAVPDDWWALGWWAQDRTPTVGGGWSYGGTGASPGTAATADPAPGQTSSRRGSRYGVPARVLEAYQRSAGRLAVLDPGCHLSWEMLAGIGQVESGHAGGGRVTSRGDTVRPILGPVLDGSPYSAISDTDGGRLDGDRTWDRAVGPMQFIPSSWERYASDGNRDGVRSPHNVDDAALATALYLCTGDGDLGQRPDLEQAVYRYNHASAYVRTVLGWIEAYRHGGVRAMPADTQLPEDVRSSPSPLPPAKAPTPEPSERPPGRPEPTPDPNGSSRPAPAPTNEPTPGPTPGPTTTPWCPLDLVPICVSPHLG